LVGNAWGLGLGSGAAGPACTAGDPERPGTGRGPILSEPRVAVKVRPLTGARSTIDLGRNRCQHADMATWRLAWPAAAIIGLGLGAIGDVSAGAVSKPAPCQASALAAAFTKVPNSNAAGSVLYTLRLTNKGSTTCSASGRPRLQLLDGKGKNLPTRVVSAVGKGKAGTVSLAHGKSAAATARFSPSVAAPGESQKGACEPNAVRVRITLSPPARGSLTAPVRPPTPVCQHGHIELSPLRAQR